MASKLLSHRVADWRRSERGTLGAFNQSSLEALPSFAASPGERWPHGARSEAAVFVGEVLPCEDVPDLARAGGSLDVVAITRRPGVLSKVAVRARPEAPTPISVGLGADHLARVSQRLDGDRLEVVAWQRSARADVAERSVWARCR